MVKINSDKIIGVFVHVILIMCAIVVLYPLYFVLIASFSEPSEVVTGRVVFWIKGFTLDPNRQIFESPEIWIGYRNTICYTLIGTLFSLCITMPAAYAMSRKKLWFKNFFSIFFVIPMYVGGGMLPTYLLVKNLGLLDQWHTQIIVGAFSIYNMIVARIFFQTSIPDSLFEAAEVDGCSQFKQFGMIALPLAKPILAVIALYYAVARWNDWFTTLIYISKKEYYSLQFTLRIVLLSAANALSGVDSRQIGEAEYEYLIRKAYMAEAMKYGIILIAALPMLIIYPFVQKHFVKGVMVGSLKG